MKRLYETLIQQHFSECDQMLFLAGPRQVGKTTICKAAKNYTERFLYLNWDNEIHRKIILEGELALIERLNLDQLSETKPILVLDEIHKYKNWKNYLKGFYDVYKSKINIIVCGSAKLNIYQKGGDSLMGRYFLYRIHPFSLREAIKPELTTDLIRAPIKCASAKFEQLFEFGGYPDPFIKASSRFSTQWKRLRLQQLLREDITELKQIEALSQLEVLAHILGEQAGSLTNYTSLSRAVRVSVDTITRWINILESFYYCFKVSPWHKNVKRSLLKEPKIYLWDWALVKDKGARLENFVAGHLLKAIHFWTDHGLGDFKLHYLRDKEKKEVDFLVTKDNKPWFLVEVKSALQPLSKNLTYFQSQINAEHAFQVTFDLEYVNKDCFNETQPIIVPLKTFLSQLI